MTVVFCRRSCEPANGENENAARERVEIAYKEHTEVMFELIEEAKKSGRKLPCQGARRASPRKSCQQPRNPSS